jgi:hypothetical protein
MNETIEISSEIAAKVIECLEGRIASCDADLRAIDQGRTKALEVRAGLVETLAALRSKLAAIQATTAGDDKQRERRPKGHGESVIIEVLAAHPGGLSIADIEKKTTVNHATVYRTLNDPKRNKGRFAIRGKLWFLAEQAQIAAILEVLNGPNGLGKTTQEIAEEIGTTDQVAFGLLKKCSDKVSFGVDSRWRKLL